MKDLLTHEEISKQLSELNRQPTEARIREITQSIEVGKADEEEVRLLLLWFCAAAPDVRECMPDAVSHTSSLVEFIGYRIGLYLRGDQKDLMRAFGLKRSSAGRKQNAALKERRITVAAKVLKLRESGKTLDTSAGIVARQKHIDPQTAKDWYTKYKEEAKIRGLYQLLFSRLQSE
jgi:hypothetical protein